MVDGGFFVNLKNHPASIDVRWSVDLLPHLADSGFVPIFYCFEPPSCSSTRRARAVARPGLLRSLAAAGIRSRSARRRAVLARAPARVRAAAFAISTIAQAAPLLKGSRLKLPPSRHPQRRGEAGFPLMKRRPSVMASLQVAKGSFNCNVDSTS